MVGTAVAVQDVCQRKAWILRRWSPWGMDNAHKGREPRFTLSSSNQLIVQARRAVFGGNLLLSRLI